MSEQNLCFLKEVFLSFRTWSHMHSSVIVTRLDACAFRMAYPERKYSLMATRAFTLRSRAMYVIPKPPWPSGLVVFQHGIRPQEMRRRKHFSRYISAMGTHTVPLVRLHTLQAVCLVHILSFDILYY